MMLCERRKYRIYKVNFTNMDDLYSTSKHVQWDHIRSHHDQGSHLKCIFCFLDIKLYLNYMYFCTNLNIHRVYLFMSSFLWYVKILLPKTFQMDNWYHGHAYELVQMYCAHQIMKYYTHKSTPAMTSIHHGVYFDPSL